MKVLQVIPYFFLSWAGGGPVELVQNMSKGLLERGHEVTIYTTDALNKPRASKNVPDSAAIPGIKICEFRSLGSGSMRGLPFQISPAIIRALARQTASFDIIHLHEYRTFQNIVAHHYARKFRVPYVLQAHGSLPTTIGKQLLKETFDRLWGQALLRDAASVIAASSMEAAQYAGMMVPEGRIETIPHGLDLSIFDNLQVRGRFRKKYGLESQKVILYLGRLHQIKGLDLLARAFAALAKQADNVILVIAGPDAGYSSTLKKVVADLGISTKVLFIGPVYGEQKLEAYVDADVYVLPSYYEIFSMTVLEACACGTPVVVTDRCAIANDVANRAGLVTSSDEKQLSGAMARILDDSKLGHQLGEGGRELVRERFSLPRMVTQLERVYRKVSRKAVLTER